MGEESAERGNSNCLCVGLESDPEASGGVMNLVFARAEMATALGRLASLLPSRTTLPVLNYVKITASEDGQSVKVEATDLSRHAELTVRLSESCASFLPLCLPLGTLLSVAKAYPGVSAKMV